ncbi:MAG: hypothetical protein WD768_10210 [Phycisphaeraceae bacterium]
MRLNVITFALALSLGLMQASPLRGQDGSKTDKTEKTDKPPNPLFDDPFTGEFTGGGMTVIIKAAGEDRYEGEIRKRGRSFAIKASLKGEEMVGVFVAGEFNYDFKCALDGESVKFTSDGKTLTLTRKDVAVPVVPVVPAVPEPFTPGVVKPMPAPVKPVDPDPAPVLPKSSLPVIPRSAKLTPAPDPARMNYSKLSAQELRHACWTRFPAGSFAVFDDSASSSTALPVTMRSRVHFTGIENGKVVLKGDEWLSDGWRETGRLIVAPTEGAARVDDMGYTRSESSSDIIEVEGVPLKCELWKYTGSSEIKGAPMKVQVQVWRSKEVDLPTLVLDLPEQRMLLEPDMVKVQAEVEYKGVKVTMGLQLNARDREGRVGKFAVKYAQVKGKSTLESGTTRIERTNDYWVSHQVPGGVIRAVDMEQRGIALKQHVMEMVDFSVGGESDKSSGASAPTP